MEYDLTKIIDDIQNRKEISISFLQRKYSLGYLRACHIFDELVQNGIIDSDGVVCLNGPTVVFLDVDGVLNCHSTKDRCGGYIGIDDKKVSLLKELVTKTNSIIVLVSSWKMYWTNEPQFKPSQDELATYLDKKLAKQGLTISDKTIDGDPFNRGRGILRYIELQKEKGIVINRFVILDDEMFDYKETKLTSHLVMTSFEQNGLEKKHIKRAIEMF